MKKEKIFIDRYIEILFEICTKTFPKEFKLFDIIYRPSGVLNNISGYVVTVKYINTYHPTESHLFDRVLDEYLEESEIWVEMRKFLLQISAEIRTYRKK